MVDHPNTPMAVGLELKDKMDPTKLCACQRESPDHASLLLLPRLCFDCKGLVGGSERTWNFDGMDPEVRRYVEFISKLSVQHHIEEEDSSDDEAPANAPSVSGPAVTCRGCMQSLQRNEQGVPEPDQIDDDDD